MIIKKVRYIGLIFSLLLIGCDENHLFSTFEEDGSGFIKLEVVNYPDGEFSDYESIEDCSVDFNELIGTQPDDVAYVSQSSALGQQKGDRCIYTFEFDNLEEAERLHAAFNLELDQLYFRNDTFTYQASSDDCEGNEDSDDADTWNLKLPGEVSSHNADKIIGQQLTWNLTSNCYDIYAESTLAQPESESAVTESQINDDEPSGDESDNEGSLAEQPSENSAVMWAIIGAMIPTLIGIIAYLKSSKTKGS